MKGIFIFLGFVFTLVLLMMQGVSAVECNADLSNAISNGCTMTSSLNLNGTYNLNINATAISFGSHGINLDCNGTTIYGNGTNTGLSYFTSGKNFADNITIRNCKVYGYSRNIDWLGKNNTFINLSIGNATDNQIRFIQVSNSSIINSTFYNGTSITSIFLDTNSRNNYITGNNFTTGDIAIACNGCDDLSIYNNYFTKFNRFSLQSFNGFSNLTIRNNFIFNGINEFVFLNGNNIYHINNNYYNSTSYQFISLLLH